MKGSIFAGRFEALVGSERFERILGGVSAAPTILIAGEPGTGKSSVALQLAASLGGAVSGTGAIVRAMAATEGMTLAEYNRLLEADPDADLALDARAAAMIAHGDAVVFESRLAGHLGAWLRSHGREGLATLLLRCAPRELARRLVTREGSARLGAEVACTLAEAGDVQTLDECIVALEASQNPDARAAVPVLAAQIARTAAERRRMLERYGVRVDDPRAYDAVLDTSALSVTECASRALRLAGLDPPP